MIANRYHIDSEVKKMKSTYLLRLNEETKKVLEEISEKQGISLSALINIVLTDYIKEKQAE